MIYLGLFIIALYRRRSKRRRLTYLYQIIHICIHDKILSLTLSAQNNSLTTYSHHSNSYLHSFFQLLAQTFIYWIRCIIHSLLYLLNQSLDQIPNLVIHSPIHSCTHSLTHSLTHSITHSPTLTHSITLSLTHSLTRTVTYSLTYSLVNYVLTQSFTV